jgi:hypothetical protein
LTNNNCKCMAQGYPFMISESQRSDTLNCHSRQLQVCAPRLTIYSAKVSLDFISYNSSVDWI